MSISIFTQMLKEYYYVGALSEADQKTYYLICRYSDKVSQRLLDIQASLLKEGETAYGIMIRDILSKPNPLMQYLKPDPNYKPVYYPVPIVYKP